jgi:hypothetical protein
VKRCLIFSLAFISTDDQIADIFTKGLSTTHFLFLKSKLKVIPPPISLRGDVKLCNAPASNAATIHDATATSSIDHDAAATPTHIAEVATTTAPLEED